MTKDFDVRKHFALNKMKSFFVGNVCETTFSYKIDVEFKFFTVSIILFNPFTSSPPPFKLSSCFPFFMFSSIFDEIQAGKKCENASVNHVMVAIK